MGAYVVVCAGAGVARFSTWCPKIIALVRKSPSDLPASIESRSIVIPMRRRRKDEPVERLRLDRVRTELEPLRRKAARWVADHADQLRAADPAVPTELNDRAADHWRPLLAIADLAGGDWPETARRAAKLLSGTGDEPKEEDILVLSDVRRIFQAATKNPDRLPGEVLVAELEAMDERPWQGWFPKNRLAAKTKLAGILRRFEVQSKPLWGQYGDEPKRCIRGYFLEDLKDAFERYLPPPEAA